MLHHLQHCVDHAPVSQAGQLVDIRQIRQLLPRFPQFAIAHLQRAGEVTQFLCGLFALPIQ